MKTPHIVYTIFNNKCPRCHEGDVFLTRNPYNLKKGLKMHEHCPSCRLKYEREPGYFYGAMYVSYALQAGLFIALFTLNYLWWDLNPLVLTSIVVGAILALFPVTFRWSRIIWMDLFTKYDNKYSGKSRTDGDINHANKEHTSHNITQKQLKFE